MDSRGKLQELLAELEHSSSLVQRSSTDSRDGEDSLPARMRQVLHLLFQDYGNVGKLGKEAPTSILKIMLSLLCLALDKFPEILSENGCSTIPVYFAKVFQLLSAPKLRPLHAKIMDTLDRLTSQCLLDNTTASVTIYRDTAALVQDLSSVFAAELEAQAPQGMHVALDCFLGAFSSMAQQSNQSEERDAGPSPHDGLPRCLTLILGEEAAVLDVAAASAHVLCRLMRGAPLVMRNVSAAQPNMPSFRLLCLRSNTDQQAELLQAIHAEASELCPGAFSPCVLFCAVREIIESVTRNFSSSDIASRAWWSAAIRCLELCLSKLSEFEPAGLHALAAEFVSVVSVLTRGACNHTSDYYTSLLSILASAVDFQPHLLPTALRIVDDLISAAIASDANIGYFTDAVGSILRHIPDTRDQNLSRQDADSGRNTGDKVVAMLLALRPSTNWTADAQPLQRISGTKMLIAALVSNTHVDGNCGLAVQSTAHWVQWFKSTPNLSIKNTCAIMQLLETLGTFLFYRLLSGGSIQNASAVPTSLQVLSCLDSPWIVPTGNQAKLGQSGTEGPSTVQSKISAMCCCFLFWAVFWKSKSSAAAQEFCSRCQQMLEKCLKDTSYEVRAFGVAALPLVAVLVSTQSSAAQGSAISPAAEWGLKLLAEKVEDQHLKVRSRLGGALKSLQIVASSLVADQSKEHWILHAVNIYYDICQQSAAHPMRRRTAELLVQSVRQIFQHKDHSEQQCNANDPVGFPSHDIQPFLAMIADNEQHPEVQCSLLDFLRTWLMCDHIDTSIRDVAGLVKQCIERMTCSDKPVCSAASALLSAIMNPRVLVHIYNANPSADGLTSVKEAEVLLLKDLRGKLEAFNGAEFPEVWHTVMASIAEVASQASTREGLWMSLVMLVDPLDNENPAIRVAAADLLHAVARKRGVKLTELISQPRVMEYVGRRLGSKPRLLPELADMLGLQVSAIAQRLVPAVLPRLVISQDMQLLEVLAQCLHLSLRDMLVNYGHHTVAYILLEGRQDIEEYAAFMFKYTEVEFDDLLRSSLRSILKEVIWSAGDHKRWTLSDNESTTAGLQPSAELIENVQKNVLGCILRIHLGRDINEEETNSAVADFLHEEQMIWLLSELVGDRVKRGKEAEPAEQLQALRCLSLLIIFVGDHMADFVPLMMTLLTRAMELPSLEVQLQGLAVWELFIRQLSRQAVEMLHIHAVRIAVILTAFLESGGRASTAACIAMEELVLRNQGLPREILCEFPPLPNLAALGAVNEAIAEARGDLSAPHHLMTLAEALVPNRPGHYAGQPLIVKAVTMMEIKRFLQQHQEWRLSLAVRQKRIPGADTWHSALDFLVAVLLKSCDPEVRSALSHRVHLQCAECLGCVGAVDPGKLTQVNDYKDALSKAQNVDKICNGEEELAKEVLKALVHLLSGSSDLEILEAATFGIQELLSAFRGAQRDVDSGWDLFRNVDEEFQAVVRPYLNTKYQLQQSLSSGAIVSPIFGSPGLSFRRWLCLWLQQLTDALPQERATIFRACTGVSRHDIPIMMLLLPHAVLSVLALGSNMARSSVLQEIHSVLQGSIQTDRVQADWQLLAQAVFILLDKLVDWVARSENSGPGSTSSRGPEESASYLSCGRDLVEGTLKEVDRRTLARAAFRCGAFARAMQYFEAAVREEQGGGLNPAARMNATYAESDVSFFISIYSELEEPDGISGFTRLRQGGPTNSDMVLAAERRGSWAEALTLYEQALQQEAGRSAHAGSVVFDSLSSHASGQLDCLLHMGHLQAVLQQTEGLALHAVGEARCKLAVKGIAAAWRMGRWNELENCLQVAHENPHLAGTDEIWEVRIGEILISMRDRANAKLLSQLEAARHELMGPLSAAAMESHLRAYPYVVRLHMLQEIEDAIQCIPALQPDGAANGSVDIRPDVIARKLHWKERLACMQISLSAQEPVLSLRRQIAAVGGIPCEEGRCFLLQAKLSRKTGHFDSAAISCFEAMSLKAEGSSLEYAKLLWSTGESHRAINILQDAVSCSTESADDTGRCAIKTKVLLQLARWMSVTGQGGHDQVTEHFLKALRSDERCEKTYFYFGKYLDQLMQDAKRRQDSAGRTSKAMKDRLGGKSKVALGQDQHHFDLLPKVLDNYASAAKHGHRLIMQSLPRLLTLWYDFGSGLSDWLTSAEGSEESILEKAAEAVADVMDAAATDIPVYSWLMVLSQLISRMCHRDGDVAAVTRQIITRATEAYPQQSFWSLVPVVRSKYKQRSKAATEIMTRAKKNILASRDAKQKGSKCQDLFSQFPALVDQLIALANYVPDQRVRRFDLTREGGLTHVTRMNPDEVILPVLDMLTPELPADGVSSLSHNAFSGRTTTIQGIKKEVEVMASLQKPKKVVFLGSDGHPYTFLAKPKDDLRKDQRLMELATALNRLFVKHPASRQRNLYLRTFNVVPLTEDCGIIQWVNFTIGFRHCCQAAYAVPGKSPKAALQAVKALYERFEKAPGKKWKVWYNEVVDMFPPMMHKWFLKQFSTPANWFDARLRFSRTTAVWSMVGHVLGLGDRHGENLLIDRMSGDCVHVDFSCLFDKGLTLEKPEMVPFRLTQNIIDSFGPSGIEGIFRSVCGITLQVLRANQETILSILETFVHDPLVEWDRQAMRSGPSARATGDSENLQARDALRITDGRLNGTLIGVSSKPSLPLSPEGHAHRLIEEAIDRENLGRMYIWWMVWF